MSTPDQDPGVQAQPGAPGGPQVPQPPESGGAGGPGAAAPAPGQGDGQAAAAPNAPGAPVQGGGKQHVPARTRFGSLWVALVGGAVVLVLLLVFILQNSQHVQVHLFGAHWDAPLGVAILMAAALGVLLVVVPAAGRIIQLRRSTRRAHRRAAALEQALPDTPDGTAAQQPQQTQPPRQ